MIQPIRAEFELGPTTHGQALRLIQENDVRAAKRTWTIRREAANQRDDTDTVRGVTDEAILKMADIVRQTKEQK